MCREEAGEIGGCGAVGVECMDGRDGITTGVAAGAVGAPARGDNRQVAPRSRSRCVYRRERAATSMWGFGRRRTASRSAYDRSVDKRRCTCCCSNQKAVTARVGEMGCAPGCEAGPKKRCN
eukprot:54761-Prymnesium_polylepis.1